MRISACLTRLVTKLRTKNWPDDQIRSLLVNLPVEIVDRLLAQKVCK